MNFKQVLDALIEVGETSSKNAKVELLEEFLEDKLFNKVVFYAMHGLYHYHINKVPKYSGKVQNSSKNVTSAIFKQLDFLRSSKGTSDSEKRALFQLASISPEAHEVVSRIVKKDLRIGAKGKSVNKAMPGLLRLMPYQRCSTEKKMDNIEFDNDPEQSLPNIIAQEKADGAFTNVLINKKGQIKFLTRNGKEVLQLTKLKKIIRNQEPIIKYGLKRGILNDSKNSCFSTCLHGELRVYKNGEVLDRQTGNGIISQCIQGTADQKDADNVFLVVWISIPLKDFWKGSSPNSYSDNFYKATNFVTQVSDNKYVKLIRSKYVHTLEEAQKFYAEIRNEGGEGAILKDRKTKWKDHTSTTMVKMKNIIDVELVLTAWYHGKPGKKYERCIGGLSGTTACGKLEVNMGTGTGFSDNFRGYHPKKKDGKIIDPLDIDLSKAEEACEEAEMQIGGILQCEAEGVIKSKTNKKPSLFLPRFVGYRFDKDEADTLKDILER